MINTMFIINSCVFVGSFSSILVNLILYQFNWAWIWIIPTVYALCNVIALGIKEDKQK